MMGRGCEMGSRKLSNQFVPNAMMFACVCGAIIIGGIGAASGHLTAGLVGMPALVFLAGYIFTVQVAVTTPPSRLASLAPFLKWRMPMPLLKTNESADETRIFERDLRGVMRPAP